MKLLSLTVSSPLALGELELRFETAGKPRPLTLIFGGPGSGKTTLLSAVANTRPGHTVAMGVRTSEAPCSASCTWWLGMDEPDRKKPLTLCSPNAGDTLRGSDPELRRDAALFERLAREGGFVFLSLSATRWFSKSPLLLASPERSVARYDVRAAEPFDDASRNDLGRDVKQALAYAAIVRVLPHGTEERERLLGQAMRELVSGISRIYGFDYGELEPRSLEPMFTRSDGRRYSFDALPAAVKHAIAFGSLPLRALWAGYPGMDPRRAQGVVAIDQIELHQTAATANDLLDLLLLHLPEVQWLVTTRSDELLAARASDEAVALHRLQSHGSVEVYEGGQARVH